MKNFKDILKNGEEDFNEQAWLSFQKKLDHHLPISSKSSLFSNKNLMFLGIGTLILSVCIFILNQNNSVELKSKHLVQTSANKTVDSSNISIQKQTQSKENIIEHKIESNTPILKSENAIQTEAKTKTTSKTSSNAISNVEKNNFEFINNDYSTKEIKQTSILPTTKEQEYKPIPIEKHYCIGQTIDLYHNNTTEIIVYLENEEIISVTPKRIKNIKATKSGIYQIKYQNIIVQEFEVFSEKNVEIETSSEIVYEKGLPILEIKTKDFTNDMTWTSTKGIVKNQKSATEILCFQKGNYEISINSNNPFACLNINKVNFYVAEEYNLLATNAFIPNSSNPKNQTFMPEALKLRSSAFELFIYDSKDKHLVFSSQSVEKSWDGIDVKTGNLVPDNVIYLWKVVLKNPEKGEKNEYNGTIIRL